MLNRAFNHLTFFVLSSFIIAACTKQPYTKPLADSPQAEAHLTASIPYYLMEDKKILMRHLMFSGTRIVFEKSCIHLFMPPSSNFKPNSSIIQPNLMGILDYVAAYMIEYPRTTAVIHGNTDYHRKNIPLAERRSHAMIAYLESQGIVVTRFETYRYGREHPMHLNSIVLGEISDEQIEISLIKA